MKQLIKDLVLWAFDRELDKTNQSDIQIVEINKRLDRHIDYLEAIVDKIGMKFVYADPVEAKEGFWSIVNKRKNKKTK